MRGPPQTTTTEEIWETIRAPAREEATGWREARWEEFSLREESRLGVREGVHGWEKKTASDSREEEGPRL